MINLRKFREERGFSQKEFAAEMDIPAATYNQYETGRRTPDIEMLMRFADFFGVSVDELIGHDLPGTSSRPEISAEDLRLLEAYHANPAARIFVNRILGLPDPAPAPDPALDLVAALKSVEKETPSSK